MRRFLHNLLAVAVLAHTLIGCCAHDVVAECVCVSSKASEYSNAHGHDHACCSTQVLPDQEHERSPVPPAPCDCCRDHCHWVVASPRLVEVELACLDSSQDVNAIADVICSTLSDGWPCALVVRSPHPPGLPAHLANSVLLL